MQLPAPFFAFDRVSRGYRYREIGKIGIFSVPGLDALPGVDHGFSARGGGVSSGGYASLNLSFTKDFERENVAENYRRFFKAADIDPASIVMDNYEHGTTVLRVDSADRGKGYTLPPLPRCDGLITDDPAVTLITGHADCMAFYAVDSVRRCIGLAHAGWRGALGRIGRIMIEKMAAEFRADPGRMVMAVGPSICGGCFEVGNDVADLFTDAFPGLPCRFVNGKTGKAHIDLWMVAAAQFMEAGVAAENIHLAALCTMEDERLFSYRRSTMETGVGGMAAYLRLK